jgi:hypothetical protein
MRVIIANNGTNITYEHINRMYEQDGELILLGSDEDNKIHITLNGWLIAKALTCTIDKRCLTCVDEVFLDTRVEGV